MESDGKETYLFPVKALSVRFKKNMLNVMQSELPESGTIVRQTENKRWVVYSKPVIAKAEAVVNYLSRYCNRIGINPMRLHHAEDKVQMNYKDYRSEKVTSMVCSAGEILRRLLLHVLPKGFMRIRYYGFMANAVRVKSVGLIRTSLEVTPLKV
ncbi:transposase [Vibrio sp. PP-XX7]